MNAIETETQIRAITDALSHIRVPILPDEYDIHAEIARALAAAGLTYTHEAPLAPRSRIDFLVGRIGVEVKKGRPTPRTLRAQLERYLQSERIDAAVVVVQRAAALPASICGKPVRLVSLNRLWGVALP